MGDHYFTNNPSVESKPTSFKFTLRGHSFTFKTDQGVFSKSEIDFGSRTLLECFKLPAVDGPFLDVGCGYGPIGLSLAKEDENRQVHMVDVNERALSLAKGNADLNNVQNVSIYRSDTLHSVKEECFAAILTNPPIRAGKKVVHDIFEQSFDKLRSGGELWVVIQKKQGAPSAMDKLEELFGEVEVVGKEKGYYILKAQKC